MTDRVLIVDDEPHIRRVMRMALERDGYEVCEAADGVTGLEQFGDGSKCSAVVLDQRMPGIDGLETLRRIKARSSVAPVVMVTAYGSVQLAVDAMKLGATDFLQKPMTPDALRRTVRSAVQTRPAIAEPEEYLRPQPPISRVTMNGFRLWQNPPTPGKTPHQRTFTVETLDGQVETVTVEIAPTALAASKRVCRRDFPVAGGFWNCQAEKALCACLWTTGRIPTGNHVIMAELDADALDVARRWEGDD